MDKPQPDAMLKTDEWSFQQVASYASPNFVNCFDRDCGYWITRPSWLFIKLYLFWSPFTKCISSACGAGRLLVSRW
jgi:hypothetical protein